jgi:hypothetical protein
MVTFLLAFVADVTVRFVEFGHDGVLGVLVVVLEVDSVVVSHYRYVSRLMKSARFGMRFDCNEISGLGEKLKRMIWWSSRSVRFNFSISNEWFKIV